MMKSILLCLFAIVVNSSTTVWAQQPTNNPHSSSILLSNGWSLSPAGRSLPLGDLPLNMQVSPSQNLLAVTNNGQGVQSIQLIDTHSEQILYTEPVGKAWYGLKFSGDEKTLYASGGNDNIILAYSVLNNKLSIADTIKLGFPWPKEKIGPTGIDIDNKKNLLYVVTKENNSLYTISLKTKKTIAKTNLQHEAYSCILSSNRNELYITLWGINKVVVYDTKKNKIVDQISTESHPNEMLLSKNEKLLYVANANSNSVSVIDLTSRKVIETISASLYPTNLTGSTTNGLAFSEDQKTLYIANADNNCLAVFDITIPGNSKSKGFIPTGWYPTSVKAVGKLLFVANGKGFSSLPNPHGPQPIKVDGSGYQKGASGNTKEEYIGSLFKGTLSIIDEPDDAKLKAYSARVYANTPYNKQKESEAIGQQNNPIPQDAKQISPIKYVFYIIKENRTYDQVLGDMTEGNGDSTLCLFPERVTPNLHALSREFVLLDNFYVDAEVSADGHNWSTAAYATDYVEKTWPTNYGGRGGTYDYEGTRQVAYPKDGFIWDYCQRAGVSYRTYGEFAPEGKASIKALKGHAALYPDFDLGITDLHREQLWEHDFDSLVNMNALPQFNSLRLPNDHTSGQNLGEICPTSAVADNDLAVGKFIEHLSHSKIWKESAVFILEDDAQNGPDHVDAHRSTAYIVSPYIQRGKVNSAMYSTSSMLRTMELILGLPPMSQYDAAALPMFACFTNEPDFTPYQALPANVDLEKRNEKPTLSAKLSAKWNFKEEDSAPDLGLNQVIWKSVKGEESEMPAPRRSAFVKSKSKTD